MSESSSSQSADSAAGVNHNASNSKMEGSNSSNAALKKPLPEQNPAFRMMGLPRLRLPSRNWMIFLSLTGSFAGALIYDKWQTKRTREKWCNMVSHIADEGLDTKTIPRKVTIYLSAPPGDGLRSAREHFHQYVKPILVSAAMDWDVIEGRKEGDVRHKTAEKIRKSRRKHHEGETAAAAQADEEAILDSIRAKNGDVEFPGVAGDIVIGRNTWKEYIRGLHEGYLGPADSPPNLQDEQPTEITTSESALQPDNASSNHDADVSAVPVVSPLKADTAPVVSLEVATEDSSPSSQQPSETEATPLTEEGKAEDGKKEEEKPKRRFPPSSILPEDYQTKDLSPSTPEIIGPSVGIRMPHLLGFRNTPVRIYRFLNRRRLQDDVGRQVAAAILASYRPYGTVAALNDDSVSEDTADVPEQKEILAFEQRDWWKKTVNRKREEHEESLWIEPMILDERISSRMRAFQLTSEDEDRAKSIESGTQTVQKKSGEY